MNKLHHILRCIPGLLLLSCSLTRGAEPIPLPRAHAHNDYAHDRPLLDALEQGFCSVEADIYLVDGELRVGHDPWQLRPGRELESLYLKPLADRARANGGSVYPQEARFILLVDIKREATAVYPVLDRLLTRYRDVLTGWEDGRRREGAVTVIVSGDRPRALMESDPTRYCAIDGRPDDLGGSASAELVPLISENWRKLFRWRGEGPFPDPEQRRLAQLVEQAHKEKRLLRFWAVPDNAAGWHVLYDAGVDLINTDDLPGLAVFLRERSDKK